MRILMISDVHFPRINGVSTSIQTFRRGLHAAGHETILIAPEYPGAPPDRETAILRVPSRGVPRDPEDRAMKLGALRALRPEIERLEPDLLHIQTPFIAHYSSRTETQGLVLLEAMALGVPVVSTAHMGTADIVNPQRGARVRGNLVGERDGRPARGAVLGRPRPGIKELARLAARIEMGTFLISPKTRETGQHVEK